MLKSLKIAASGSAFILVLSLIPAGIGITVGASPAAAQYGLDSLPRGDSRTNRRGSTRSKSRRGACTYHSKRNGRLWYRCWNGARYVWVSKAARPRIYGHGGGRSTYRRTKRPSYGRTRRTGMFLSMRTTYGNCIRICRRFGSSCRGNVRWRGSRNSYRARGVCIYRR